MRTFAWNSFYFWPVVQNMHLNILSIFSFGGHIVQLRYGKCSKITNTLLFLFSYKIRGELYSKFSFGEVYHRIYRRKFSFMVTRKRSSKT